MSPSQILEHDPPFTFFEIWVTSATFLYAKKRVKKYNLKVKNITTLKFRILTVNQTLNKTNILTGIDTAPNGKK